MEMINDTNFEAEVLKSEKPVLVDFFATWCNPCRMLGQELEELSKSHPELTVAKIDVDENEDCFAQFGEQSIPLLCFFKGGKLVKKVVGYIPAEKVLEFYNE